MTPPPLTFRTPSGLSPAEAARLTGLATAFAGRPCSTGYEFSPVRGMKFLALWNAGASCCGHWNNTNGPKYVYRLPGSRVLELCEALRLAQERRAA